MYKDFNFIRKLAMAAVSVNDKSVIKKIKVLIISFLFKEEEMPPELFSEIIKNPRIAINVLYFCIIPKMENPAQKDIDFLVKIYFLLFRLKSRLQLMLRESLAFFIERQFKNVDETDKRAFQKGHQHLIKLNTMTKKVIRLFAIERGIDPDLDEKKLKEAEEEEKDQRCSIDRKDVK